MIPSKALQFRLPKFHFCPPSLNLQWTGQVSWHFRIWVEDLGIYVVAHRCVWSRAVLLCYVKESLSSTWFCQVCGSTQFVDLGTTFLWKKPIPNPKHNLSQISKRNEVEAPNPGCNTKLSTQIWLVGWNVVRQGSTTCQNHKTHWILRITSEFPWCCSLVIGGLVELLN